MMLRTFAESLLGEFRIAKDATFLHTDSKYRSDCADAQADLRLRCARLSEGTKHRLWVLIRTASARRF